MATVALYAAGGILGAFTFGAGTALAGVVAGLGAMAGAYVDQNYLFPLFEQPTGQKISSLPVTGMDEGSPMDYCLGPQNRVGGTAIWMSSLKRHKKSAGGKGGSTSKVWTYSVHLAIAYCDCSDGNPAEIDMIWADSNVCWRAGKYDKAQVYQVTVYDGSTTQTADPLMQALIGSANVPAYRGTAYVVFNDFQLEKYGNRVPNFTFLCRRKHAGNSHISTRAAITKLCERAGLDAANLDMARVPGNLYGYTISGPQAATQNIEPLMKAYNLVTQEAGGVLRFLQIGLEDQINVDADSLGSHANSGAVMRPLQISDVADTALPKEVNLQYIEPAKLWLRASHKEKKLADMGRFIHSDFTGSGKYYSVQSLNLPLVFGAKEAARIAYSILWRAHVERQQVEIHLPPSYIQVQENDVLNLSYVVDGGPTNNISVRVSEVNIGQTWEIVVKGVVTQTVDDSAVVAECPGLGNDGSTSSITNPVGGDAVVLELVLLDVSALLDADTTLPTLYYGLTPANPDADFAGAGLFESSDEDNWTQIANVVVQADMGVTLTAPGNGPVGYWDNETTFSVYMQGGELSSTDAFSVLNGANHLYVGAEMLAFQTAVLTSANTYTLSKLLRGLRNTESFVSTHGVGEHAISLSLDSVNKVPLSLTNVGASGYFRPVPNGGLVADTFSSPLTYAGNCLKQFSPCHVRRTDGVPSAGDITFSWIRRTRALTNTLRGPWPLLATSEEYEIDLYSGSTLLRSALGITSPSWVYTATMQAADSFFGGSLTLHLYQINDQIGRGFPAEVTL